MTDHLLQYRPEFPILERTTYLISNSLGAMPRGVYDAMKGYADTWATRGVRAWEERWWMLAAEVGDEIGALMNAPKGSVSTHQNVTTCQAVVASCFDFSGKRNKVVYSDMNFPSVMYFWEAQQSRGARVHMVKTDDGITVPLDRLLDAIDETTLLVPVSHVIFRSAFIQDARAIVEKAHKVGALVVLDTFQSLGTVPVDVQALNTDFACGGVLKWLCGGPGVGYLYVRPDLGKKLEPKFTGWTAHENPFAFEMRPRTGTDLSQHTLTEIEVRERSRFGDLQVDVMIVREDRVIGAHEPMLLELARVKVDENGNAAAEGKGDFSNHPAEPSDRSLRRRSLEEGDRRKSRNPATNEGLESKQLAIVQADDRLKDG